MFGWIGVLSFNFLTAQKDCRSFDYVQQLTRDNPSIKASLQAAADFLQTHEFRMLSASGNTIITIPVVVHVLYHFPTENISDDLVRTQIAALSRDYRKQNADTSKIPPYFKSLAADCHIEFQLATADPKGRATSGIVHKYTPVTKWSTDDEIKSSAAMGDDAWDANSYLNIWVGTLDRFLGYSSMPGGPSEKDGVVISNTAIGITHSGLYGEGRTAVHEVGHWLGLRHLWGDAFCGDDSIADTPKQQTFTNGCPTGIHISCDNGPYGDMYMDYMDFTDDACLLMFTEGQKERMLALFEPGGARYPILASKGLSAPTTEQIPPADNSPQWLQVKIYPNPAHANLIVNMEVDPRWLGKDLLIWNDLGQLKIRKVIDATVQNIDISNLKPGIYFLSAEKDGDKIRQKFVKM